MHPRYGALPEQYTDACYMQCCGHTSVHLCASSLQNLAIPQDFYFHFSISVVQSWWLQFDGVGLVGFKSSDNAFYWPSCTLPFSLLLISRSLLSFYGLVLWGWGLHTDRVLILLLLLKKVSSARLGESDIHPISPKTPGPQYQPIDRKKRRGKRVGDYSRDRTA